MNTDRIVEEALSGEGRAGSQYVKRGRILLPYEGQGLKITVLKP